MKTGFFFLSMLLFAIIFGCSAKLHPAKEITKENEEIVQQRMEELVVTVQEEEVKSENPLSGNQSDPDSLLKLEKYSVYREYYKQGNFIDAYPFWTWVLLNAPDFRKTTYVDGVEILTRFINTESNQARKDKLIDTLMLLYDTRIKYFNEEGFVLGKKGSDLFKYRPSAYEECYKYLDKSS